jgi:hypothetical protein
MRHARADYNRIQDPAGIIPADMRVFLILEKDLAAVPTIRAYAVFAERLGASAEFVDSARRWAADIEAWQQENPDLVKVPDAPKADCPECHQGTLLAGVCDTCGYSETVNSQL